MRKGMSLILVVMASICVPAFLLGMYFAGPELYLYFKKDEVKAQSDAEAMFVKVCQDEGLDPSTFSGPSRPNIATDDKLHQYNFRWTRNAREWITVGVVYLPHDVPYSMSPTIVENHWQLANKTINTFP